VTFARPALLVLGPAASLLLALALQTQWRRLRRVADTLGPDAAARLFPRATGRFPFGRLGACALAAVSLSVAMAEPIAEVPEHALPTAPLEIAIAVDLSRSMIAEDARPSRMARATEVVAAMAEALPEARFSLTLFADWPYALLPATDDPDLVMHFAPSLSQDLVLDRDQGTTLGSAVTRAHASLLARPRTEARRIVVLLSDGGGHEEEEAVLAASAAVVEGGGSVWAAGLGTGRPVEIEIPVRPGAEGTRVLATLDEALLIRIAEAGRGRYLNVSDAAGSDALIAGLAALGGSPDEARSRSRNPLLFWLTLAALGAILWDGSVDSGRWTRPRARGMAG